MKSLRQLCTSIVLMLAFSFPVFAGGMECGVASPPPSPAPTSSVTQGGADGQIPTGPGATTTEGGAWSGVVWGVVEGVLALL